MGSVSACGSVVYSIKKIRIALADAGIGNRGSSIFYFENEGCGTIATLTIGKVDGVCASSIIIISIKRKRTVYYKLYLSI